MRLSRYNPIDIELALGEGARGEGARGEGAPREEETWPHPFGTGADRAFWTSTRQALGPATVEGLIARAERFAVEPVPALPATLYLEYARTGRREGYQAPMSKRRTMLSSLAVAELLEGDGRFLDPILDVAWAICEEGSWAMPAHQSVLADPERPVVDLGAAMTAFGLGELVSLFGDKLDPALSAFVRHEIDRRCITPYLTRHDNWWLYNTRARSVNNWTAVCTAGVAGAAIYTEPDAARLAEILARAARSLDDYLDTFDADGGSSEGPGYWSYGFGYYTLLAHLVEARTNGQVRFLDGERIRAIAAYPGRTQLSPHRYVAFSDCDPDVRFVRPHLAYLADRLDLPELAALANEQDPGGRAGELTWAVRSLVWRPPPTGAFVPAKHDWFGDMMWMLARVDPSDPDALAVAVKGGHNGEMHNQNDVGSLVVHVAGESVVADPGRGRYTKAYFGPTRYDHVVKSSLGHPVPIPNGLAQVPGKEHGATLLEHRTDGDDLLRLDLAGAYPAEAGLVSLVRTVVLHRGGDRNGGGSGGWVELTDEPTFEAPGTFETVLTTLGTAAIEGSAVVLRQGRGAVRVGFDPSVVSVRIDTVAGVDFPHGSADLHRVVFALPAPAKSASVRLRIEPAPAAD